MVNIKPSIDDESRLRQGFTVEPMAGLQKPVAKVSLATQ